MKKITAKEVYDNEVTYRGCMNDKCKKSEKRGCDCGLGYTDRKFTSYKALGEDGLYYRLSGSGTHLVKAGQEITGVLTTSNWESNGKSGVNNDLKLPSKEDNLKSENERLQAELIRIKGADNVEEAPIKGDDAPPHTDEDDESIPF